MGQRECQMKSSVCLPHLRCTNERKDSVLNHRPRHFLSETISVKMTRVWYYKVHIYGAGSLFSLSFESRFDHYYYRQWLSLVSADAPSWWCATRSNLATTIACLCLSSLTRSPAPHPHRKKPTSMNVENTKAMEAWLAATGSSPVDDSLAPFDSMSEDKGKTSKRKAMELQLSTTGLPMDSWPVAKTPADLLKVAVSDDQRSLMTSTCACLKKWTDFHCDRYLTNMLSILRVGEGRDENGRMRQACLDYPQLLAAMLRENSAVGRASFAYCFVVEFALLDSDSLREDKMTLCTEISQTFAMERQLRDDYTILREMLGRNKEVQSLKVYTVYTLCKEYIHVWRKKIRRSMRDMKGLLRPSISIGSHTGAGREGNKSLFHYRRVGVPTEYLLVSNL
eukprot:scaffold11033_cov134-Cylindrotheca_fusiformis.AAC.2